MNNHIKIDIKPNYGSNYSYKYSNLSINDMNLSFINSISSAIDKMKDTIPSITLGLLFSDVTPVITHLFNFSDSEKQGFTSHDDKRYYSPTTKLLAVKPNRHSLAIFVPKICLTNYQRFTNGINKNTSALQARHKYSTVESANIYDGLIEPNTRPFWGNKLNRLVTVVKTRRPFFMGDYKLTKLLGTIQHG
ncbi:hypothetical protein IQ457_07175 [Psychrobacter sp. M9-54-1]|uniref:hypothetical protein n=1 Tax=Psychrobacter sp. M9-54-1 TaxID=2782386 RepID=UPI00190D36E1|nr:hypothetical protein [Psychrobacter sp. M9-54-1]MBK3393721.1 hypothetical protein [Psychrobacter sp. M9-54-1]